MEVKVLDIGLVMVENAILDPQGVINKIESLDKKRKDANLESIWSPWQDEGRDPFCYQFRLSSEKDIRSDYPFYNEEIELWNILTNTVDSALEEYYKLYPFSKANLKGRERPNILKYVSGGELPPHQDIGVSSRSLSVLSYLNDDYEGGEISFPQSNITIKPKAGTILFFPSNFIYVHTIAKMKSGVRYAIPSWFHNRYDMYMSDGTE
jgi:hypothetical protein